MKKRTFTHISQQDFNSIKLLQRAGLSANQASKATKRTHRVVTNIYNSDTLNEYKDITAKQHIDKKESKVVIPESKLAATDMLHEVIRQAKAENGIVLTTYAAFTGFDDLYDFVKEASDNEVTVTFAPMGK